MSLVLATAGFGLVVAAVLGIAAVGMTLQFGVTNYINFAYGELITMGAYAAFALNQPPIGMNLVLAVLLGAAASAILAFLLQRFVLAPFVKRRAQLLFVLIVTFVVGIILNNVYAATWGTDFHEMPTFLASTATLSLGPLTVQANQVIYFAIAIIAMASVQLLLTRTRLGRSMRAMSDDLALAKVCGLNTQRIADVTWLITGFVAGLAGIILAMQTHTFNIDLGDTYLFLVFAAVIVGGIGRAYGALVGALVIGMGSQMSVLVVPSEISVVAVFAILVVIMVVRPQGLLGAVTRTAMER